MIKVDIEGDVTFKDKKLATVEVAPLMFREMVELWSLANNAAGSARDAKKMFQRMRIVKQCTLKDAEGAVIPYEQTDLLTLPASVGKVLADRINEDEGSIGSLVKEGDGVTSSIVYKLGVPLKIGKNTVTELEFLATTYGQVEDVLAADSELERALMLIETVAKPLGVKGVERLPQMVVDKIKPGDGIGVMNMISPSF